MLFQNGLELINCLFIIFNGATQAQFFSRDYLYSGARAVIIKIKRCAVSLSRLKKLLKQGLLC